MLLSLAGFSLSFLILGHLLSSTDNSGILMKVLFPRERGTLLVVTEICKKVSYSSCLTVVAQRVLVKLNCSSVLPIVGLQLTHLQCHTRVCPKFPIFMDFPQGQRFLGKMSILRFYNELILQ